MPGQLPSQPHGELFYRRPAHSALALCLGLAMVGCGEGAGDWTPLLAEGLPAWYTNAFWKFEDGVLYPDPNPQSVKSWVATRATYSNFELRLEFRLRENSNGGVLVRVPNPIVERLTLMGLQGFEIQLIDNASVPNAPPRDKLGAITGLVGPDPPLAVALDEWHRLQVRVRRHDVTVLVNGEVVLSANTQQELEREPLLVSLPGLTGDDGHVGFVDDGAPVEYRDVAIRRLLYDGPYIEQTE